MLSNGRPSYSEETICTSNPVDDTLSLPIVSTNTDPMLLTIGYVSSNLSNSSTTPVSCALPAQTLPFDDMSKMSNDFPLLEVTVIQDSNPSSNLSSKSFKEGDDKETTAETPLRKTSPTFDVDVNSTPLNDTPVISNKRRHSSPPDLSPSDRLKKVPRTESYASPFQKKSNPPTSVLFKESNPQVDAITLTNPGNVTQIVCIPPFQKIHQPIFGPVIGKMNQKVRQTQEFDGPPEKIDHVCPVKKCGQIFSRQNSLDAHLTTHIKKGYVIPDWWLEISKREICPQCTFVVAKTGNFSPSHEAYVHPACRKKFYATHQPVKSVARQEQLAMEMEWIPRNQDTAPRSTDAHPLSKGPISLNPPPGIFNHFQTRLASSQKSTNQAPMLSIVTNSYAPSLASINSILIPTRSFIPPSCIPLVAKCMNFAIDKALTKNDMLSWSQLFAFPKCCLSTFAAASLKSASARENSLTTQIKSKLTIFLDGGWISLWDTAVKSIQISPEGTTSNRNWIKSTVAKAEAGNLSGALRMINSGGVSNLDGGKLDILKSLHPSCETMASPKDLPMPANPPIFTITPDIIDKVIKSFPIGTAPGPDGLRVQHLLDVLRMLPANSPNDIRPAITRLINSIMTGRVPSFVPHQLSSSRLIPLNKKDGGIRPVAIGNVWRRLSAKVLNTLLQDKIRDHFKSRPQYGVGSPLGTESVAHMTRLAFKENIKNPDYVFLQVDLVNAFNRVSRKSFFKKLQTHFPELLPFISLCYSKNPSLYVTGVDYPLESANGTQQGCPLSPFLFALVLSECIEEIKLDLPFGAWYLDDGILGGNPKVVAHFFQRLLEIGPNYGLTVNTRKSSLCWPSKSMVGSELFPNTIERSQDGLVILGTPVGIDSYVKEHLQLKVKQAFSTIEKLPLLNDPQIAFTLLSKCNGFSKVSYFLRSSPTSLTQEMTKEFDGKMMETLGSILGSHLPDSSQVQATLPSHLGGLGLRSTFLHAPAAFLSSINSCKPLLELTNPNALEFINAETTVAADLLYTRVDPASERTLQTLKSQQSLSSAIDTNLHNKIIARATNTTKARLFSCAGSHGPLVLNSPLSAARGFKLSPYEFNFFVSTRIGLPNFSNDNERCSKCGSPIDKFGYHFGICKTGDFNVSYRHNSVRNLLFKECQKALWNPKVEIGLPNGMTSKVPGDIYLPVGAGSQPIALDVTIVHPLAYKDITSKDYDTGNLLAEKKKNQKHLDLCTQNGVQFKPLSIEFYGRLSPNTKAFILKLGTALSNRSNGSATYFAKDIERKLVISIIRSGARAVHQRTPSSVIF